MTELAVGAVGGIALFVLVAFVFAPVRGDSYPEPESALWWICIAGACVYAALSSVVRRRSA